MPQSSVIFAALFVGFLIYVTIKGHLQEYAALLWTAGTPGKPSGNPASRELQTSPSSPAPGVQNPFLRFPELPLMPGLEPPSTGGGFGQF